LVPEAVSPLLDELSREYKPRQVQQALEALRLYRCFDGTSEGRRFEAGAEVATDPSTLLAGGLDKLNPRFKITLAGPLPRGSSGHHKSKNLASNHGKERPREDIRFNAASCFFSFYDERFRRHLVCFAGG